MPLALRAFPKAERIRVCYRSVRSVHRRWYDLARDRAKKPLEMPWPQIGEGHADSLSLRERAGVRAYQTDQKAEADLYAARSGMARE